MRGPEGRGRHAQRMTRPQRPESWRLQRVGVGEGWGAGVGKPSWLSEMTLSFLEGFPISSTFSVPCFPNCVFTIKVLTLGATPQHCGPHLFQ